MQSFVALNIESCSPAHLHASFSSNTSTAVSHYYSILIFFIFDIFLLLDQWIENVQSSDVGAYLSSDFTSERVNVLIIIIIFILNLEILRNSLKMCEILQYISLQAIFQQVFSHDFLIMTLSTEPNHGRKLSQSLWTVLTLIGSK